MEPSPPVLTIPQLILIVYSWISCIVYAAIVVKILKGRSKNTAFRSTFFTIVLWNSLTDGSLFIHLEIIMKPRKLRYFNLFGPTTPQWYASVSLFLTMVLTYVTFLCYLPMAFNRFTAFRFPIFHRKLWTSKYIGLIYFGIWSLSILVTTIAFGFSSAPLTFRIQPNGVLQIASANLLQVDSIVAATVTTLVTITCLFLYTFTAASLHHKPLGGVDCKQKNSVERRYFLCVLLTSCPLLLEFARTLFQMYGEYNENMPMFIKATELWFYVLEISISIQCWTLLLVTPAVRNLIWRKFYPVKEIPTITVSLVTSQKALIPRGIPTPLRNTTV